MKLSMTAVLILASVTSIAFAQDWYHDRDERYRGDQWRPHVFSHIREDLEHIRSARNASEKENARLARTREELARMQADLEQGRFDNGLVNDVIDSLRKSANDDRLSPRDRDVLADDANRLHEYQRNHNNWPH
jgi:sigma54-dependent transcription regulator